MSDIVLHYCDECASHVSGSPLDHDRDVHGKTGESLIFLPVKKPRTRTIVIGYRCDSCGHICDGSNVDAARPAMEQHMVECPSLVGGQR